MTPADEMLAGIREAERGPNALNAFITLAEDGATGSVEGGGTGRLAGVAVAVKDNLVTSDMPTTCGSRLLASYRSPFEATVVRRIREAGALVAGKTNMDEFGMGSSNEHSAFGPARNPRDPACVPGGSSGGSAAAVAAGYVPMALGSDTGGSVRQPAALCGVVGIKPTYGRVSRYGLVAFASSLDQVGTLGRTVRDATLLAEVVAGHDPRDATSATGADVEPGAWLEATGADVAGLVVGVPVEYFPESLDPELGARAHAVLRGLKERGAEVRDVSLPHTGVAVPTYYVLATAEASSNLARFDGVRYGERVEGTDLGSTYRRTRGEGLGPEVRRRILLGTYVLSAGYYDRYYGTAQKARALIRRDFRRVFESGVDVLFTPTTPGPAFRLGERLDDPLRMYLSDVFTVTASLAGLPAVSVPIGTVHGLPVGGQLIAPWWREDKLLRAAAAVERVLGAAS